MAKIIQLTEEWIKEKLKHDTTGHDWQHIHRVRQNAMDIVRREGGDSLIVELSALLHDVVDDKITDDVENAYEEVKAWLHSNNVEENQINAIIEILSTMSFKGGDRPPVRTFEGKIVQDADRLDAIGAIGIARTFMYAGAKGHLMHDENMQVRESMSEEEYRNGKSTAVQHFYEKLLKLKDLMNTNTAKQIAAERHYYMEQFLLQFEREWNGKHEDVNN